ncbi:zinc-dependent metalloprotease [Gelidibacter japonicus]|uniref:zinc-dependent metalloprotease n=1 Tax=Gelidibacter japonicus TaxID=1962232 RepID=UPI002AFE20F6|nr:zinc-dependent metalloprotease [Gelidibacter japonicus]
MRIFIFNFLLTTLFWAGYGNVIYAQNPKTDTTTKDQTLTNNFLKAHLINGKLQLELPYSMLNIEMLFVKHGDGYNPEYQHIIWSKFEERIVLEAIRVKSLSGVIIPLANNSSYHKNTLEAFPILNNKKDSGSFVIDISDLVLNDNLNWRPGSPETIIKSLSFIKKTKNLPNEVLIQTEWTVSRQEGKVSKRVDFSIFLLPSPMAPRLFDYRMGFTNEDGWSGIRTKTHNSIANISRWRLTKKYPDKTLSVPIQPITFILSAEIPKKWRPYVKAGILEWLPAFEAAGFKNAIEVQEEVEGDRKGALAINSVNHSMVRWGVKRNIRGYENLKGATVNKIIDFRSGEILKSDIIINSTIQYLSDRYFIRCAALDTRAQKYPFPDDLVGELIQSVIAHETGHTFGIKDANFGEYTYPFEKMRDKSWLQKMGHTPSVMNYARHNYIPQPEDKIPSSLLIPKVGPTDIYNIVWAYKIFPNIVSPHDETPLLDKIVRFQDSIPWYRYNNVQHDVLGPGSTNEVVENTDPIRSTELGLKNIQRVLALIPKVNKDKMDHALMERLYIATLELWYDQMLHVASLLGSYTIQYKSGSQNGRMYTPIAFEEQEKALNFILKHAFNPPEWLIHPEWMDKITFSSYPDFIMEWQKRLMYDLISPWRLKRFEYLEFNLDYQDISTHFISQIRKSLFKELIHKHIEITPRRQELQHFYITNLIRAIVDTDPKLNAKDNFLTYSYYSRSLFMNELQVIKNTISKNINNQMDYATYGHLNLILKDLEGI